MVKSEKKIGPSFGPKIFVPRKNLGEKKNRAIAPRTTPYGPPLMAFDKLGVIFDLLLYFLSF